MKFDILTIFPGFFTGFFEHGIVRRAQAEGLVNIGVHDLRAFTHDRHRTVDDRPFGGGEGMVLKPQPLAEALESLGIQPKAANAHFTTPPSDPAVQPTDAVILSQGRTAVEDEGSAFPPLVPPRETQQNSDPNTVPKQPVILSEGRTAAEAEGSAVSPLSVPTQKPGSLPDAVILSQGRTAAEGEGFAFPPLVPARETQQNSDPNTAPTQAVVLSEAEGSAVPAATPRERVILLSAQGRPFTQAIARELATLDRIVLICGRYEGVDERINELYCDIELSIGDYVLSGGELGAAVILDATMRLIPGVLGNQASGEYESFGVADATITSDIDGVPRSQHGAGGLLDYPHYTRPAEFGGLKAPDVLLNGDHQQIRRWRREQQLRKTLKNRPDLLDRAALTTEDQKILAALRSEIQR